MINFYNIRRAWWRNHATLFLLSISLFCNNHNVINAFSLGKSSVSPSVNSVLLKNKDTKKFHFLDSSSLVAIRTTNSNDEIDDSTILTSAVLQLAYDGSHFFGWSAANDGAKIQKQNNKEDLSLPPSFVQTGRKRKRGKIIPNIGKVRSVEGVVRNAFSKVYGSVAAARIQVEGCSRTDKGVHAQGMVALVYCLTPEAFEAMGKDMDNSGDEGKGQQEATVAGDVIRSIPGKRTPHPLSRTDSSYFEPLPFKSNLGKLLYVLNRMLPPDVRALKISPMPANAVCGNLEEKMEQIPFHPSLHTMFKTYQYTFSIGTIHDPMRWRHIWHVDQSKTFDLDRAKKCAELFVGTRDFVAFRGAFRGSDRGREQNTTCTITTISIDKEMSSSINAVDYVTYPVQSINIQNEIFRVTITGDRFLYKMVRNMVGAIVAVGKGKIPLSYVHTALQQELIVSSVDDKNNEDNKTKIKHRDNYVCAPPHGLTLTQVSYPDNLEFSWIGKSE